MAINTAIDAVLPNVSKLQANDNILRVLFQFSFMVLVLIVLPPQELLGDAKEGKKRMTQQVTDCLSFVFDVEKQSRSFKRSAGVFRQMYLGMCFANLLCSARGRHPAIIRRPTT